VAKVDIIQTSFVGGEFGASLLGRTDFPQYANALAIVQNWIVRPYGSLVSCPGTMFVNAAQTGGSTTLSGIKLVPFVFSVTDAYVIEMGGGNFSFYTSDAVVVSGGTQYTLSHTYAAPSISSTQPQYCQNHDVLYLAHAKYPPQTLVRLASANWTISSLPFTGGPFMIANTSSTTVASSASASGASTTLSASGNIFTPSSATTVGHNSSWWSIGSTITSSTTGLAVQGCVQITTVTNPSTAAATVYQTLTTTAATTSWAEGSWSAVRGYPSSTCFYQGRLFFARTDSEPQTVWGSGSFNFTNFAVNGGADSDAINIQLSAVQGNEIKWLVPMNDLIAGTYGGEFAITPGLNTGNPLTPSNVQAIQQSGWGSEAIIPKKIGNFAYYVQRGSQKLREIFYLWTSANYKSVDKTILSPQINGGGFVDIAYQQNPDTVLWALCTNGTLATMTREVDQDVQGWARQVTSGSFTSIAIIPSQTSPYDEVWVVAQRTINGAQVNYIEVFQNQVAPLQQDKCFYVHSGLTYNAFTAYTSTSISLSATNGSSVLVTSSASYFTAGMVGNRLRAVGALDAVLGEAIITGYTSSSIIVVSTSTNFNTTTYAAASWGTSVTTLSGLTYLNGATVSTCADGGVDYPNKIVSGGSITMGYNYFVITVGLPYTQQIQTLTPEPPDARGTSQGKKQRINQVGFKVNNSYAGFQIGRDVNHLSLITGRNPMTLMGTPPTFATGQLPNINFAGDYVYGASMIIQNTDPLPIELLSIITSIETFDK